MTTQIIPLVDFSSILDHGATTEDWNKVSKAVDEAFRNVGFMYIQNHGILSEIIESAFQASKAFFTLDSQNKMKYQMDARRDLFGYVQPNQQQLDSGDSPDSRESFDFLWNSAHRLTEIPEVPNFYSSLWNISHACLPLISKLLKVLYIAMGLSNVEVLQAYIKCLSDPTVPSYTAFRTLYYPPTEATQNETIRLAPHTDFGILTLLFQDDAGGLQVKMKDNSWVAVNYLPGTILINTGNILELWSGRRYKATLHRVVSPIGGKTQKVERQSMAFFVIPDDSATIEQLNMPKDASDDETKISMDVKVGTAGEYVKELVNQSFKY